MNEIQGTYAKGAEKEVSREPTTTTSASRKAERSVVFGGGGGGGGGAIEMIASGI